MPPRNSSNKYLHDEALFHILMKWCIKTHHTRLWFKIKKMFTSLNFKKGKRVPGETHTVFQSPYNIQQYLQTVVTSLKSKYS